MSRDIYVYESFSSNDSKLMGKIMVDVVRGKEVYSFEYDQDWIKINSNYKLDPDLLFYNGRQYPIDKTLFGILADSMPDRWGRTLMRRRENIIAKMENRKPRVLFDSDYLLGVLDETRIGALRFKCSKDGEFQSPSNNMSTPPFTSLRQLQDLAMEIDANENADEKWLELLLKPGSSLGGARPKSNVVDQYGNLWIAKFPTKNDDFNIGAWEKTAIDLAMMCGLNVPESRMENLSKYGSTFLTKRFDRDGDRRIHFASAMTLLGKTDGENGGDGISYLHIASFIKGNGANPKSDLNELWKRIVFNMLISNTDDHLRNHGFILCKNGWTLSPLYDVNPVPYGNNLSLLVDEFSSSISLKLAINSCKYYELDYNEAKSIVINMTNIIKNNWERLATKNGISQEEIKLMKPAFSRCYD